MTITDVFGFLFALGLVLALVLIDRARKFSPSFVATDSESIGWRSLIVGLICLLALGGVIIVLVKL